MLTFDAEGGTTTVTLKVVDVSSITDVTWAGSESGSWSTDANWVGGNKVTALNNAVFPAEATMKQVAVDRNEAADQLKFTGGEYAVSGEGQLTSYGMLVTNGATVTVSAPLVPKGSFTLDVAEDAALDFASPFVRLSAGEFVATKEVEVSAGATLELSNAETAYGFETLSGAGTIRNGTIARCAIACDGTAALTFDNVTLDAVTVDFGHDETDQIFSRCLRRAMATASVRFAAPIFASSVLTCTSTLRLEMPS